MNLTGKTKRDFNGKQNRAIQFPSHSHKSRFYQGWRRLRLKRIKVGSWDEIFEPNQIKKIKSLQPMLKFNKIKENTLCKN